MKPTLHQGQLVQWNDDRGFGHIRSSEQSQDVFLHISDIKRSVRRPRVGDIIFYQITGGKDGRSRACNALIRGATQSIASPAQSKEAKISKALNSQYIIGFFVVLPLIGSVYCALTQANFTAFFLYPAMSCITFILYAEDKSRAARKAWRIPENTLQLCDLLGGWIGGFTAQQTLHHKNLKRSYQVVFWSIVMLHQIGWITWFIANRK